MAFHSGPYDSRHHPHCVDLSWLHIPPGTTRVQLYLQTFRGYSSPNSRRSTQKHPEGNRKGRIPT